MKTKFIFGIVLLSMFGSYVYADFPVLKREYIDKKKDAIASCRRYGIIIDHGLGTAASGILLYFGYKLFKAWTADKEPTPAKTLSTSQLTRRLLVLEGKFEKHKDPSLFSKSWLKGLGKSMMTSFISSSLAGIGLKIFDKYYKRYHCFDNILEFITVRFGSLDVADELLYNAQLCSNVLYDAQNSKKAKAMFILSLRNVVYMVGDLVAFMEYKVDSFESTYLSEEDILISQNFFDSVNKYCAKFQELLHSDIHDMLFDVAALLKNDMVRFIENFKGLENRVVWMLR